MVLLLVAEQDIVAMYIKRFLSNKLLSSDKRAAREKNEKKEILRPCIKEAYI